MCLVQLEDGNYRLIIDYTRDGFHLYREYVFAETHSDAKPLEGGDVIKLEFKCE